MIAYLSAFIVWCILTGMLLYHYIVFSWWEEIQKWGTFVEAIYEPISYLPYWGDHSKNLFYQTLLFQWCSGGTRWWLCDIKTEDNKTYTVRIKENLERSDKQPITLDDVLFTYQDIVINNTWNQPYLVQYEGITITPHQSGGALIITFPIANNNNIKFFELPILPQHTIKDHSTDSYIKEFAANPITSSCVELIPHNNDYNLVFGMQHCPTTHINYYQLRSFETYTDMINKIQSVLKNDIALYKWPDYSEPYQSIVTPQEHYMSMFFNTTSAHLSPRIQRALWWLIYSNFSHGNHEWYMLWYTGLLTHHQSDGTNINTFLSEKNTALDYDKQQLEKAWVQPLWESITLEGNNKERKAYYVIGSNNKKEFTFIINTNQQFSNTKIRSNNAKASIAITTSNNYRTHTIKFTIGGEKGLRDGVNTITLEGTQQGVNKTIGVLDIYSLWQTDNLKAEKIKVIYYNNKIGAYTAQTIEEIFKKNDLNDFFDIIPIDDELVLAGMIKEWQYDILLTPLTFSTLADIAAMIVNNDPESNPSRYKNIELAKLLDEYTRTHDDNLAQKIEWLFSTDMPFVILGQNVKTYWLKDSITYTYTWETSDDTLKSLLVHHASIVSHHTFRAGKLFERDNFTSFLQQNFPNFHF